MKKQISIILISTAFIIALSVLIMNFSGRYDHLAQATKTNQLGAAAYSESIFARAGAYKEYIQFKKSITDLQNAIQLKQDAINDVRNSGIQFAEELKRVGQMDLSEQEREIIEEAITNNVAKISKIREDDMKIFPENQENLIKLVEYIQKAWQI